MGVRIAARAVAVVALMILIGFGALMALLAKGPIEIDALGSRVADALTRRFDGAVQFSFGSTQIARTEHGPTITVDRVLAVANGRTIVAAPRAELSLDLLSLARFEALPRRIEVFDLYIRLLVMPDGALAITAGGPNEEAIVLGRPPAQPAADGNGDAAPPHPRRTAVLQEAAGALRAFFDLATSPKSPLAALSNVAVRGGKLEVDDRAADRTTTFDKVEIAFEKSWRGAAFLLGANGPNGRLSAVARASGTPDTERQLDIEVHEISMDEFALVAGMRRPPFDTDAMASFKLRFVLEANRDLREASGRVQLGAGYFRLEEPDHEPIFFDEISSGFHWDTANRRFIFDSIQYFGGETQFAALGALDPPARSQEGWKLAVSLAKPGGVAPDHPGDKLLVIDKANLAARIFLAEKRCEIERAEIGGPDVALAASGAVDWVNGPHVRIGASAGQSPIRAMLRLWPTHVGSGARTWLIGHAKAGVLQSGTLAVDFDKDALIAMRFDLPPPDESLKLDFQVAGGAVNALPGVPDVTGIEGAGHITGRTAQFSGTNATMETAPGRRLAITNGLFSMPSNDGAKSLPARLDVRVAGSVEAVADILAKEAINDHATLPLDSGSLKGQVEGKLRLDFRVGPEATGDDVKVYVNASVANFSADHLLGKEKFEGGSLAVTGDPSGIRAAGTGRIFGAPATLDLRKGIGQPAVANMNLSIDEAARAKLGFTGGGVTGPIGVKVAATLGDRDTKAAVDADLSRVAFDNPAPGLVKAAGKPGRATFTITQRDSGLKIDDFVFEAGTAMARGSLDLSPTGELQAARFTQARLSPGDDMRIDATRAGGDLKIAIRGASIDARPFLKSVTQTSEPDTHRDSDDFDIELKAPILTGFAKQALINADLRVARKAGALKQFAMSGQFGRAPFAATLARGDNGQQQINVSTGDAGALLAFADLYPRMEGGALSAAMQFADKSVSGMLTIRSFQLRDEPALRRLVLEGSPRVDPNGSVKVDASLVAFDRLQVVFSRSGGRLTLRDGVMNGPNIGLTVEGVVDSDRETMSLNGTFIPAYTVNNFFSKIPLVGVLLGGGWNEGLFALNYKVTGRPTSPQISINPLSVAPGFLRKIFGAIDGGQQPAR